MVDYSKWNNIEDSDEEEENDDDDHGHSHDEDEEEDADDDQVMRNAKAPVHGAARTATKQPAQKQPAQQPQDMFSQIGATAGANASAQSTINDFLKPAARGTKAPAKPAPAAASTTKAAPAAKAAAGSAAPAKSPAAAKPAATTAPAGKAGAKAKPAAGATCACGKAHRDGPHVSYYTSGAQGLSDNSAPTTMPFVEPSAEDLGWCLAWFQRRPKNVHRFFVSNLRAQQKNFVLHSLLYSVLSRYERPPAKGVKVPDLTHFLNRGAAHCAASMKELKMVLQLHLTNTNPLNRKVVMGLLKLPLIYENTNYDAGAPYFPNGVPSEEVLTLLWPVCCALVESDLDPVDPAKMCARQCLNCEPCKKYIIDRCGKIGLFSMLNGVGLALMVYTMRRYKSCHHCRDREPLDATARFMHCACQSVTFCDRACQTAEWSKHSAYCYE